MKVEVVDNKSTHTSPFLSPSWLNNCGAQYSVYLAGSAKSALSRFTSKGIKILATPPWALDCGLSCDCTHEEFLALSKSWSSASGAIKVIDLPPSTRTCKLTSACIKQHTPKEFRIQWRHTRYLDLADKLPSTRVKQIRRASREGIVCTTVENWTEIIELHNESRDRKSIRSNSSQLGKLLSSISSEEYSFAVEARNAEGECIASGGFVMVNNCTCLYSFGGQKRSKLSGIASVAMLAHAMEEARDRGATVLDFGGSSDPGVDRFYKEFGATSVPKARLIQVSWWLRPFLGLVRPDLV
ncbi:MAG TPA: hypothetical protein EYN28_07375 [Flavobacteriales bacterium]|jgi:hypothetical protein|nr:hypothetical protein [Flavobacteriales bacterium]